MEEIDKINSNISSKIENFTLITKNSTNNDITNISEFLNKVTCKKHDDKYGLEEIKNNDNFSDKEEIDNDYEKELANDLNFNINNDDKLFLHAVNILMKIAVVFFV